MPGGSVSTIAELPPAAVEVLHEARRGALSTIDVEGAPHVVPVCFAVRADAIVSAIDHKPKITTSLARLANIERDPRATLLVDRWDEDWSGLGWVMIRGRARIERPGSANDVLAARYAQYAEQPPAGPVVAIEPVTIRWWMSR